jgi:hypothetical protein
MGQRRTLCRPPSPSRQLTELNIVAALFSFGINLVVPVRTIQMKAALGNQASNSIASIMARNSSIGAAVEFLLNPIIGQYSDNVGRKPFIVGCCLATGLIHASVLALPRNTAINSLNRILTAVTIACFFTAIRAALSDIVSGAALAQASAEQLAWISLGGIISPIVGGKLGPLNAFLTSAVCCEASAFYFSINGTETQKSAEHREITFARCNPMRFLQLFRSSDPILSVLATVSGLQSVGNFNGIYDVTSSYLSQYLQWGSLEMGRFWTCDAVGGVGAGLVARSQIALLGPRTHTTLSNLCFALGVSALGTSRSSLGVGVATVAMSLGRQRGTAVDSAIVDRGQAVGMGRGEISASISNLTAVLKVVTPMVLGRAFELGDARGFPGLAFFIVSGCMLLAEGAHQHAAALGSYTPTKHDKQ